MRQKLQLETVERMALVGAMIGLLPPSDKGKREEFDRDLDVGEEMLLRAFEREDSTLAAIEVRERLRGQGKILRRFGQIPQAVRAVLENRQERRFDPLERESVLTAIIDGAAAAARYVGLVQYADKARLAAYCAAIAYGPDFYRLPLDAPAGVMRPLGHVPSVDELTTGEGR